MIEDLLDMCYRDNYKITKKQGIYLYLEQVNIKSFSFALKSDNPVILCSDGFLQNWIICFISVKNRPAKKTKIAHSSALNDSWDDSMLKAKCSASSTKQLIVSRTKMKQGILKQALYFLSTPVEKLTSGLVRSKNNFKNIQEPKKGANNNNDKDDDDDDDDDNRYHKDNDNENEDDDDKPDDVIIIDHVM